jgi:hypothetical protein
MRHQEVPVEHVNSKIDVTRRISTPRRSMRKEMERVKESCGRHRADSPSHDDGSGTAPRKRRVTNPEHWLFKPAVSAAGAWEGRSLVESRQDPRHPKRRERLRALGLAFKTTPSFLER